MSNVEQVWCVFDNTASGAAIKNAWELSERLTDELSMADCPINQARLGGFLLV
jgi:hypothetical protein